MTNLTVDEKEVKQHGLPMRGKNPKKGMPSNALGISSSAIRNDDVDVPISYVCFETVSLLSRIKKESSGRGCEENRRSLVIMFQGFQPSISDLGILDR